MRITPPPAITIACMFVGVVCLSLAVKGKSRRQVMEVVRLVPAVSKVDAGPGLAREPEKGREPERPREVMVTGGPLFASPQPASRTVTTIYFTTGGYGLDDAHRKVLKDVARPSVRYVIHGHTDTDGDPMQNQLLSLRRGLAVRDALARFGVSLADMKVVSHGSAMPVSLDSRINRRVEVEEDLGQ